MPETFLIFGHRGSPKRLPENTIPSFEEALRAGADGFETDLRLLSDRTAVLFHDDEWQNDEIEHLTSMHVAQRGAQMARVRELEAFASRATMILEVKRSKWEDVLLSEIGGWPNTIVASFDHSVINELSIRGVTMPLGLTLFGFVVGLPEYAVRLGASWVFPNFRYVDSPLVASLHDAGIKVVPWTANRSRDWERLREAGCDGVITDYPAEAVEWRAAGGAGGQVESAESPAS